MARIDLAKSFWKTVKTVSIKEIASEAERPFALAVVGAPNRRDEVMDSLFPPNTPAHVIPDRSLLRSFDSTSEDSGFPVESGAFDIIIDAGGGRAESQNGLAIFSLDELESWDKLVERLLDEKPELMLSLARRFPGLRRAVAQRVIRETAVANAEFAMLSALPGVLPIIGPLLPAGAIWDILMLTKN